MHVITRTHENEEYGVKDYFEVEMLSSDGEQIASITLNCHPENPEDNTFDRDLSDVFNIRDLIQFAYDAGKAGQDLTFEHREEQW